MSAGVAGGVVIAYTNSDAFLDAVCVGATTSAAAAARDCAALVAAAIVAA